MNFMKDKLHILADVAHSKIEQNKAKPFKPGKWPRYAYNSAGERSHLLCSLEFLFAKLDEEVAELKEAALQVEKQTYHEDMLKEAGDVTACAAFIVDKMGAFAAKIVPAQITSE